MLKAVIPVEFPPIWQGKPSHDLSNTLYVVTHRSVVVALLQYYELLVHHKPHNVELHHPSVVYRTILLNC